MNLSVYEIISFTLLPVTLDKMALFTSIVNLRLKPIKNMPQMQLTELICTHNQICIKTASDAQDTYKFVPDVSVYPVFMSLEWTAEGTQQVQYLEMDRYFMIDGCH